MLYFGADSARFIVESSSDDSPADVLTRCSVFKEQSGFRGFSRVPAAAHPSGDFYNIS
jgi:hypothetical protein